MERKTNPEEVGKYTYGHEFIQVKDFETGEKLQIGKYCSLGGETTIFLGGNHNYHNVSTFPFSYKHKNIFDNPNIKNPVEKKKDTIIGNDVWIGYGVTIMSGVEIGDGAVIAANSHVVKNVGPYEVWGGNPAKMIKKRFSDPHIEKLLSLKWWNLPDDRVNEISPYLCLSDPGELLKNFNL